MISHKLKCIFVEVPKTGSSSIRSVIGHPQKPHMNICQIKYDMQHYWTRSGGLFNKFLAGFYYMLPEGRKIKIGTRLFNNYFKFGFVRNPWDRVVSLYLRKEGLQMRNKISFEEFVEWIQYSSSTSVHSLPHTNQLDWFVDPHGNILVDFIGKFENLQNDWSFIAKKLNLPENLPHVNFNPLKKRTYTEFYSDKTRQMIAKKFHVDINYFQYKFGE